MRSPSGLRRDAFTDFILSVKQHRFATGFLTDKIKFTLEFGGKLECESTY